MTHWILIVMFSAYNQMHSAGPFISKAGCEEAARVVLSVRSNATAVCVKDEVK